MLMFKAQQVVAIAREEARPWEFNGKSGVTHTAKIACIGQGGEVASIKLKAKSADELEKKIAKYPQGKPADVLITEVVPVFRSGDRKASAYEYVG